jgi:hypothetical protein
MMNKKGLSDIVATVLIVLLALAAVAIVWGFLRPMFNTAAQETDLRSKCFSVDIQPDSCRYTNLTIEITPGVWISNLSLTAVARNMGGEAAFMNGVVNKKDGSTYHSWIKVASGPKLGSVKFEYIAPSIDNPLFGAGNLTKFTVAGVVQDNAGNEEVCPGTTISCTWVAP